MLMMSQLHGFNAGGEYDPYWDNVVLLMRFNNNFQDEKGTTIVNNSASTTTDGLFAQGFFGSNTGFLETASNDSNFVLFLDDFTLEFWMYRESGGFGAIIGKARDNTGVVVTPNWLITMTISGPLMFLAGGGVRISQSVPSFGAWHHLEFGYDASESKLYYFLDGVLTQTATGLAPFSDALVPIGIGAEDCYGGIPNLGYPGGANTKVYLDELRITKGVIRHTENFTPPTVPFPNS